VTAVTLCTLTAVSIVAKPTAPRAAANRLRPIDAPSRSLLSVFDYSMAHLRIEIPHDGRGAATQPATQPTTQPAAAHPATQAASRPATAPAAQTSALSPATGRATAPSAISPPVPDDFGWRWLELALPEKAQREFEAMHSAGESADGGAPTGTASETSEAAMNDLYRTASDPTMRIAAADRLAASLYASGRHDEAAKRLEEALPLADQLSHGDAFRVNLGFIYLKTGRTREGLEVAQSVIRRLPEPGANDEIGARYAALGLVVHHLLRQTPPHPAAGSPAATAEGPHPQLADVHRWCEAAIAHGLTWKQGQREQVHPAVCTGMAHLWRIAVRSRMPETTSADVKQLTFDYLGQIPVSRFTWRQHALVQDVWRRTHFRPHQHSHDPQQGNGHAHGQTKPGPPDTQPQKSPAGPAGATQGS
jgi:hypothetical protein